MVDDALVDAVAAAMATAVATAAAVAAVVEAVSCHFKGRRRSERQMQKLVWQCCLILLIRDWMTIGKGSDKVRLQQLQTGTCCSFIATRKGRGHYEGSIETQKFYNIREGKYKIRREKGPLSSES